MVAGGHSLIMRDAPPMEWLKRRNWPCDTESQEEESCLELGKPAIAPWQAMQPNDQAGAQVSLPLACVIDGVEPGE